MRELRQFKGDGYNKGRNVLWQVIWHFSSHLIFQAFWFPIKFRPNVLRFFGAEIGERVKIRSRVKIHWPWKLKLGDDVWIGEGAWLLNLEPIQIGRSVCISQEAVLCTGSHDLASSSFEFKNQKIVIEDGVWVCMRALILPGTIVTSGSVIPAGTILRKSRDGKEN